MILPSDLSAIEIFAALAPSELQHFAATAADIRLQPGEWLIREEERCSFFVLLEGNVQVTKNIHGVDIVIRAHGSGEFFGEFAALLVTAASASIRATSRCRLARFKVQQLQELIQDHLPSSEPILRMMIDRFKDAQRHAKAAPRARAVVSGSAEGSLAQQIRGFLAGNRLPYTWETPLHDQSAGPKTPSELRVVVDGDKQLINPSLRVLAQAFGFQTGAKRTHYDLVIVGAGPAGMAAAVYGASEGLRVLMIERASAGGQAGTSSRIENFFGFPAGISGVDLSDRALKQATRFGAEIAVTRSVERISSQVDGHCVTLDGGDRVLSRALLLATGVDWRRLDVPGLETLLGRGVLYGASRTEAMSVRGKIVFIVGGGNSAGQAAMFFADYAEEVRLLIRGPGLAASMSQYLIDQLRTKRNIYLEPFTEVAGVEGQDRLNYITARTQRPEEESQLRRRPADALFVMIGAHAKTNWLPPTIERDANGFLRTGSDVQTTDNSRTPFPLETSLQGVFCAGDVRHGSIKRVASGVGEGSMAIAFIHQYLAQYTKQAGEADGKQDENSVYEPVKTSSDKR